MQGFIYLILLWWECNCSSWASFTRTDDSFTAFHAPLGVCVCGWDCTNSDIEDVPFSTSVKRDEGEDDILSEGGRSILPNDGRGSSFVIGGASRSLFNFIFFSFHFNVEQYLSKISQWTLLHLFFFFLSKCVPKPIAPVWHHKGQWYIFQPSPIQNVQAEGCNTHVFVYYYSIFPSIFYTHFLLH